MVDKILQIPMQKRTQLNENITKLELAIENETRRAREFLGKKKAIEAQIYNEKVNAVAKKIGRKYEDFLDSYKYCRKTFYELGDDIQEAYNLDKNSILGYTSSRVHFSGPCLVSSAT